MSNPTKNVRSSTGSAEPLDAIDERILAALVDDARISNKQLAELVGIAPSTALMRTRALSERGIIEGFEAVLSHAEHCAMMTRCAVSTGLPRRDQHARVAAAAADQRPRQRR